MCGGGGLLDAALFGASGYISVGFIERCLHLSELFRIFVTSAGRSVVAHARALHR